MKIRNMLYLLIAFTLIAQLGVKVIPDSIRATDKVQTYYVNPELSSGLNAVDLNPESMGVYGTINEGVFTFTENTDLSFTVETEEGWSFNNTYSYFFNTDNNNRVITEDGNNITFTYHAKRGVSIPFSDLTAVLINATPEKLPTLYVSVDGGIGSVDKEDWVSAEFKLEAGTKIFESGNTFEGTGAVKGRGNASWGKPQNPYSIKLDHSASLLGIPATKKYALVASYSDASFMRNYIAYKSALYMLGIQYSPKIEFVEVYFDGEYHGIYSLTERIDIEDTKVNIEEVDPDSGNLTGGYIIEKNSGDKIDWVADPWIWAPFQGNPNTDVFTIKAPDADPDGKMIEYLSTYISEVHDAIMTDEESAREYIDFDSWADFLILQELAKNIDGNLKTSCFMIKEKDSNILRMDAPWDFDFAFGNLKCTWTNGSFINNDYYDCPVSTNVYNFMVINSSCPWYKTLYEYEGFKELVRERYSAYRVEMIPKMQNMIYEQAAYLANAAVSHAEKWVSSDFNTEVNTLKNFLNGRITWLDSQWLDTDYQTVALNTVIEGKGDVYVDENVAYGTSTTANIVPYPNCKIETVLWNGIDVTADVNDGVYQTPIMMSKAELTVIFTGGDGDTSTLEPNTNFITIGP